MDKIQIKNWQNKFMGSVEGDEWRANYEQMGEYLSRLRRKLFASGGSLLRAHISECRVIDIEAGDLMSFYKQYWYKQSNGVAHIGQGSKSIEKKRLFPLFIKYEAEGRTFAQLNADIIRNPGKMYKVARHWIERWKERYVDIGARLPQIVLNRFFVAAMSGGLPNIPDRNKMNELLGKLWFIEPAHYVDKDWFDQSILLIDSLQFPSNIGRERYKSSIFYWYLFEKLCQKKPKIRNRKSKKRS